ncbi:MAG TPA: transcriptional regulator [Xanthomonadales bacterium]|nr:transcriptional regulator [Xanthomonadales bacterium]
MTRKLHNIGPKSAAWLRQVGIHDQATLAELGPVEAYVRIRRAGFRPSLNLLYALEGALCNQHWQEITPERRSELVIAADAACAGLPPTARNVEAQRINPVTYIAGDDFMPDTNPYPESDDD